MIDILHARRRCMGWHPCISSSKNKSSSNPTDQQIGASDEAVAVGVVGTGNSVTLTDAGAVKGALDLATRGIEGAYSLAGAAQASNGGLLDGALKMATEQNKQFASAIENVKTADVRSLIFVGLAVVGLAAVAMFAGSKKG